jgi:zinc transport system substrate-binding protein
MRTGPKLGIIGGGIAAAIIIAAAVSMNASVSDQTQPTQAGNISTQNLPENSKIRVITSFYPLYEFVRNVGGERTEVTTFIPIGVEPHDWEPTPSDIQRLRTADVFVYNGANFEPFLNQGIFETDLTGIISIETANGIELIKAEEEDEHNEREGHDQVFDPHIWLDPILAKHQVNMIKNALIEADPAGKQYYEDNALTYAAKLDALDARVRSELSDCEKDTFVSFHHAFGYFAKRYDLNAVALTGVTPEAEASPAELKELVEFARTNNIKVIYSEELIDPRLADVLASEVGAQVMILSPIEGLSDEVAGGMTYLEKMEQNLQNLKVGLECS